MIIDLFNYILQTVNLCASLLNGVFNYDIWSICWKDAICLESYCDIYMFSYYLLRLFQKPGCLNGN